MTASNGQQNIHKRSEESDSYQEGTAAADHLSTGFVLHEFQLKMRREIVRPLLQFFVKGGYGSERYLMRGGCWVVCCQNLC